MEQIVWFVVLPVRNKSMKSLSGGRYTWRTTCMRNSNNEYGFRIQITIKIDRIPPLRTHHEINHGLLIGMTWFRLHLRFGTIAPAHHQTKWTYLYFFVCPLCGFGRFQLTELHEVRRCEIDQRERNHMDMEAWKAWNRLFLSWDLAKSAIRAILEKGQQQWIQ